MSANETVLPGERLRRAREEKGLSQEEASQASAAVQFL